MKFHTYLIGTLMKVLVDPNLAGPKKIRQSPKN
jgi:hypothetical protein